MRRPADIYLDHNATTRPDPAVVAAMMPYLGEAFGNPSSPYTLARSAALAVHDARRSVARLVGARPEQIVFTSGGTESNAMGVLGWLDAAAPRREILVSAVEHASVWAWRARLAARGFTVRVIPVCRDGMLDLAALESMLSRQTALVAVMLANNETGVILPVARVVELARRHGTRVHCDAVQAGGKIPVDLSALGVDSASLCAHKMVGPKGVGAVYLRDTAGFVPLMLGGEQEAGLRPGTEPVPQIAGFGKACELAGEWLAGAGPSVQRARRDAFEAWLKQAVSGVVIAGEGQPRLPNTTLALIPGVETEPLLACMDMAGVAVSSGSACASGAHEPSHVLKAMGLDVPLDGGRQAVVRVSSGRAPGEGDDQALRAALGEAMARLRGG